MTESRLRRAAALTLAAAAAVCCMLTLGVPQAQTHSRHEGSQTLFKGTSGPYELLVEAVPLVGFLEVTVVFAPDAPDAQLPYSPRVVVMASREGVRIGPEVARQGGAPVNEYVAVLKPDAPGRWDIVVNIDGEPGSATLTLPIDVVEGRSFPWTALFAGLGILLPILWLAFAPRKKRRRER